MMGMKRIAVLVGWCLAAALGCGDDDDDAGTEAMRRGLGAACTEDAECREEGQSCLTEFKGGYCGLRGCTTHEQCPTGSACVAHDDGNNYCFLICAIKDECNRSRPPEDQANCESSITFVGGDKSVKACVPPS